MSFLSIPARRTRTFAPIIDRLHQMRAAANPNRHVDISHMVDRGVSRIRATGVDGRY